MRQIRIASAWRRYTSYYDIFTVGAGYLDITSALRDLGHRDHGTERDLGTSTTSAAATLRGEQ
jgi:hypothetical protein